MMNSNERRRRRGLLPPEAGGDRGIDTGLLSKACIRTASSMRERA
jgi:hypothetical protein